jgi:ferric iron reductase protein FhuF
MFLQIFTTEMVPNNAVNRDQCVFVVQKLIATFHVKINSEVRKDHNDKFEPLVELLRSGQQAVIDALQKIGDDDKVILKNYFSLIVEAADIK